MKKTFRKNVIRDLTSSPGRFIAIFIIIALGSGFFAGIGMTAPSMKWTAEKYFEREKLADMRLMSTMGITEDDVKAIASSDGVAAVMPRYSLTAKIKYEDTLPVFSIISLPKNTKASNASYLDRLTILEGRMPKAADECIIDAHAEIPIGEKVEITGETEGAEISILKKRKFEVVGICNSSEYISFSRGRTALGSGEIAGFIYVSEKAFDSDYFTDIAILFDESSKISPFGSEYEELIEEKTDELERLTEERAVLRHDEIVQDARDELSDSQAELDEAQAELDDAKAEADSKLADALLEIEKGEAEYQSGLSDYEANLAEIENGEAQLAKGRADIEASKKQIEEAKAQFAAIPPGVPPERLPINPDELRATIEAGEAQIAAGEAQLNQSEAELTSGRAALEAAKLELDAAAEKLASGRAEYDENAAKARTEIADGQREIDDGQKKIDDGLAEVETIETPEWLFFTRDDNPGYDGFKPNYERISSLATTVPPFMFLIAALVCLTTMTRLVEEQRTQVGTLKAIGLTKRSILMKYLLYSGVISLLGSVFGVIAGVLLFPGRIWHAYSQLYSMGDLQIHLVPLTTAIALIAGIAATMIATFAACYSEQKAPAAELMRPKAPRAGKRVLLERIPLLWKHLSFHSKVTTRNLFRYKKRLIMTVIGVAGCCALLLTGMGLKDSIRDIADRQYGEIVQSDVTVMVDDEATSEEIKSIDKEVGKYGDYLYTSESAITVKHAGKKSNAITVYLSVPKEPEKFSDFVIMPDAKHLGKNINLTKLPKTSDEPNVANGVISKKLADTVAAKVGDVVNVKLASGKKADIFVSGIATNYIYNYIYITPEDYEKTLGSEPVFKIIMLKSDDTSKPAVDAALTKFLETDGIDYAYSSEEMKELMNDVSKNMGAIILLIRLMAAALAIVVLYNLININITEREREIATLKVLGYKKIELFRYIFSESMILTVMGTIAGLFVGIALHSHVMNAVEIDEVAFPKTIHPLSYILAVLFTLICCLAVNIMMQPKLHRIEPVSSLKSPE
ncbi:MAG: FtsX-like permease family protein [Clostridiales Family XIII bacterium]|jgi:putative ABC transport system permease protein|nr:FtsX-like permease family protein [Clostridiales Family XIII bacterium]